jgi:glutathione S-transferase
MQLILYYAPNACSLVPYMTLTEAGAPFEVRPLNFRKSQHNDARIFAAQSQA